MEIVALTVAPLIHYAPFYMALASMKEEITVTVLNCDTDTDLIHTACKLGARSITDGSGNIVLALTSTTDLLRIPNHVDTVCQELKILLTLIPRVPLYYVCPANRAKRISNKLDKLNSGEHVPGRPMRIACYPERTTSHWIVSNSFPKESVIALPNLKFTDDLVTASDFTTKYDVAVTLHPWRYPKNHPSKITVIRGPASAPFAFTATLFHKNAVNNVAAERQLQRVRERVLQEIADLYACFELSGFNWQRHCGLPPAPVNSPAGYAKKLKASLESLGIYDGAGCKENELQTALSFLAKSRTWILPEPALESIAGYHDSLESIRAIREKRADQHPRLTRLQVKDGQTKEIVGELKTSLDLISRLIFLHAEHTWDTGKAQTGQLIEATKILFSNSPHRPSQYKPQHIKMMHATLSHAKFSVPLADFRKILAMHGFHEDLVTEMFQQWERLKLEELVHHTWDDKPSPFVSICLAYNLATYCLPAHWVMNILKSGDCKCAFETPAFDPTVLYVANVAVETTDYLHSLLAFHTLSGETCEAKAQWDFQPTGKRLEITTYIHSDPNKGGRNGLERLLARFADIRNDKDPFDPEGSRIQATTRMFKTFHEMRITWAESKESWNDDQNARLALKISVPLGVCDSEYRL